MRAIDIDSFMAFCKNLEGRRLHTVGRRARFFLKPEHSPDRICYVPESSGKNRLSEKRWIERVLNRYAQIGSLRPIDYRDLTVHASYTLALIKLYIE